MGEDERVEGRHGQSETCNLGHAVELVINRGWIETCYERGERRDKVKWVNRGLFVLLVTFLR